MRKGVQASISGAAGAAGEPLMWALEHLGIPIPPWVHFGVVVVCITFIVLAGIMAAHIAAVWLRTRGRPRLGQSLIAVVGVIFVFVGASAITYAVFAFGAETSTPEKSPSGNGIGLIPGAGGNATVEGNRSGAVGGNAGDSGLWPGGKGGDVVVKGNLSYARGGSGSNAPQPDGVGGDEQRVQESWKICRHRFGRTDTVDMVPIIPNMRGA